MADKRPWVNTTSHTGNILRRPSPLRCTRSHSMPGLPVPTGTALLPMAGVVSVGAVGPSPVCRPEEVLDLLALYSEKTRLWVEIGLQSMHNETLLRTNRGHTYEQFTDAIIRTKLRGLRICVHVILGRPGETREMMMQTPESLAGFPIDGLKIHHLYIAENTILAKFHKASPVQTLTMEEYVSLACDFLERIPSHVAIQRLTGEIKGGARHA